METELKAQELLSALADGELEGEELAQALDLCTQDASRVSWQTYHLIGDVLRSPELARASDSERFLLRLRAELARSPCPSAPKPSPRGRATRQPMIQSGGGSWWLVLLPWRRWPLLAGTRFPCCGVSRCKGRNWQ